MLDALQRQIRWAPPKSAGKFILIDERDHAIFQAINKHGHLPSNYLFHFYKTKNWNTFQKRLKRLFNGSEKNGPYLTRPKGQWEGFYAHCQYAVYGLHDNAKQLLNPIEHTDHFVHQLMGACYGASLDLLLKEKYIHLPVSRLTLSNGRFLIPDALFGIDYGGKYRLFAVEIDRGNESVHRTPSQIRQTSFWSKVEGYREVLESKSYKEVWSKGTLMVLTVTTSQGRAQNLLNEINDPRFIFQVHPVFGDHERPWEIPETLLPVLHPYMSIRGAFDITK